MTSSTAHATPAPTAIASTSEPPAPPAAAGDGFAFAASFSVDRDTEGDGDTCVGVLLSDAEGDGVLVPLEVVELDPVPLPLGVIEAVREDDAVSVPVWLELSPRDGDSLVVGVSERLGKELRVTGGVPEPLGMGEGEALRVFVGLSGVREALMLGGCASGSINSENEHTGEYAVTLMK